MKHKNGVKQKSLPEDFRVNEVARLLPQGGEFALYRLTKRGLGTPEAIDAILRRWKLTRRRVSLGGLKDRHAVTSQSITIHHGPRRNLTQTNFELTYQGQVAEPFDSKDIEGNAFQIALRNLGPEDVSRAERALAVLGRDGVANYFDQQRFGSVGQSRDFIARAWCAGDHERAIWLILAEPNPHEHGREKVERQRIRKHWGDWGYLRSNLSRSWMADVVALLADRPDDFRSAIARVRVDLRSLYLAAFQSHLWNRMLAELLRQRLPLEQLADIALGPFTMPLYRGIDAEQLQSLRDVELPLPSARIHNEAGPWRELIDRVLQPVGLRLEQLRVKYPRDSFFSKGSRPALLFPDRLEHEFSDDELNAGRRKLTVRFKLPRGAYATLVTRRILMG